MIERIAITFAPTRMNVECSACNLDVDFLSQGSGTPILYLTRCGHICCDMCRTNWFASGKETCPKCRQPQTRSDLIRIYYDIAQRAQPSTPPTVAMDSKGPGTDLQVSSERFLEVVADQATDTFGATRDFLQTMVTQILPSHISRILSLVGVALHKIENDFTRLRAAHQQLEDDHDALKVKYKTLKRKHIELAKNGEKLARKHEQDLKRMREGFTIQESSLRRDLQVAHTRAEVAESSLSLKDGEIQELRESRLLFKKKYHALKQKRSQDSRSPNGNDIEGSLVILD